MYIGSFVNIDIILGLFYKDVETGWYYLNSRYYNPEIGRFINADGQLNGGILGKNMYAYAVNNPVMMVDPTGYNPGALALGFGFSLGPVGWTIIGIVAVVYVVAVVAIVVSENSTPGGFSSPSIDTTPGGFSSPPIDSVPGGFSTALPDFTHEVFNSDGLSTGYMFSDGGSNALKDILDSATETTNGNGIARNYEKSGGYGQTLEDFNSLNPDNVRDIETKYGMGKVGILLDKSKVVARPGSETGGPTLEIKQSNSKVFKIRY